MSFSLKKKQPFKRVDKSLQKLIQPEYYDLLTKRVGGEHQIEAFSQNFIPILVRWSFEAFLRFCAEQGVFSALGAGKTTKELLFDLDWKNQIMLQDLLDLLVDQDVLRKQRREYRPSTISMNRESDIEQILSKFGLNNIDKDWIKQSAGYRIIFSFYNKLITNYLMESMATGLPTTTLKGSEPSQLTTIYDSLLITPANTIPRMAAIAYAIAKRNPKNILDLNCSTGRGTEELLICQSNAEMVLGVDTNPYQLKIAQRNIDTLHGTHDFPEENVEFKVVDYTKSLTEQLSEFVGTFDMVLINQLPSWIPNESHSTLIPEIWNLLNSNGIIALYQPLRPSIDVPWPDEWLQRVIDGFYGFPNKSEFLQHFNRRNSGKSSVSITRQSVIPLLSYVFSS